MSVLFKVMRNRGPSIWLIFTYIVQFFTLILMVLFIFPKRSLITVLSGITHFRVDIFEGCVNINWSIFVILSIIYCFSWVYSTAFKTIKFSDNETVVIMESKWQDQGCLKFEKIELELNWTSRQFEVQFVQAWLKGIFISVAIIPHRSWISSKAVFIMFIRIKFISVYSIKFLYEIWDYYNKALFYVSFSDFSPSIHSWIVFLDWILKSKLTNISYKDMQNLSSPSDCIQFSIRSNKRMLISCIIHISDSRSSTINWGWGVEIQTSFECFTTKYIMIQYLSYKLNYFDPPVM